MHVESCASHLHPSPSPPPLGRVLALLLWGTHFPVTSHFSVASRPYLLPRCQCARPHSSPPRPIFLALASVLRLYSTLDYPSPTPSLPPSHHYLLPSPLVPPLWDCARSVAVGSVSLPLSGDATLLHRIPSLPAPVSVASACLRHRSLPCCGEHFVATFR